MRENTQYFHVNWIDGMKINKNIFIAQDNAIKNDLHDVASLNLSKIKYGVLAPVSAGKNTFNVNISLDSHDTLRVTILSCQAITLGGVPINISAFSKMGPNETDAVPSSTFQLQSGAGEAAFWVVLTVNPFENQPAGNLIINETPPRFPFVLPVYDVQVVSDTQYSQFANHPSSLIIGKVIVKGSTLKVDDEYIPPCFSISSHPALLEVFSELENSMNKLEVFCSKIIQKIYIRKQKNDLSELVLFLCERTLTNLTQVVNDFRSTLMYESPAYLIASFSGLSRTIKNTIDLHIGSGKDILINYFNEWCEPKQGEIEKILVNMANEKYDNNDIYKSIAVVVNFVDFINELFEILSNLEFIGKRKEGYIVDEKPDEPKEEQKPKISSRFLAK